MDQIVDRIDLSDSINDRDSNEVQNQTLKKSINSNGKPPIIKSK